MYNGSAGLVKGVECKCKAQGQSTEHDFSDSP